MGLISKEKKPLGKIRSTSTGGSGVETSPLRPTHVPKLAPCRSGCPNATKIRDVLLAISQTEDRGRSYNESYKIAFDILAERNPFPATIGRVCPHPCEENCNRQYKDGSVAIHSIERFIGDYALEHNFPLPKLTEDIYPEKIAVIGSGPAGLSCAFQLARRGYKVKVFEAFAKPGGMLRYGIPRYRLPENILDGEIKRIIDLGVEIECNMAVGRDIPYDKIREEFDAIFVGIGAHKGKNLGLPGEESPNVFTGTEFLNKVNRGQKVDVGKKVLVIGGGDTAIDAARVSRRLAAEVTILYRRTRNEMPAIAEEVIGAEEEGVKIEFLVAPKELLLDNGKVVAIKCQKMQLGEPDKSGRRRPVPIEGAEEIFHCDTIIAAISQEPDFYGLEHLREGEGWIKIDNNFQTKDPKAYSGGDDLELGLAVIAIYQGRMAAETIHSRFRGIPIEQDPELSYPIATKDKIVFSYYVEKQRNDELHLPPNERLKELEKEFICTLTEENVIDEARRCMSCGSCFDCGTCWSICQDQVIHKPVQRFQTYTFKLELCKGCNKCAEACPCGYIEMKDPLTGNIAARDPATGKVIYNG